jgi:4'-phosphopantetheinyl transferase
MSEPVRLGRGEVHVWSFALPATDRRLRRAEAQRALRQVLAAYLDEDPRRIELRDGAAGKPALAWPGHPLRFNLSHSGALALVAVAFGREVGVDVEEMTRTRDFIRLARRWLAPGVAREIEATPRRRRPAAFYAAWTRHEATGKCLGAGLATGSGRPLPTVALDVGPSHAATLAVAAEADAMLPSCQTRPPGKVARLGAGKALALLSSAAASSART